MTITYKNYETMRS